MKKLAVVGLCWVVMLAVALVGSLRFSSAQLNSDWR
jgi:hypothetical protein